MHAFKTIALSTVLLGCFTFSGTGSGDSFTKGGQAKVSNTQESTALPNRHAIETPPRTNETYGSKHYESPTPIAPRPAGQKLRYGDRVNKTPSPDKTQPN